MVFFLFTNAFFDTIINAKKNSKYFFDIFLCMRTTQWKYLVVDEKNDY